MIVTTQHIDEASRCDRVIVLRDGRVIFDDVPATMAAAAGLDERVVVEVAPGPTRSRARPRCWPPGAAGPVVAQPDGGLAVTAGDAPATTAADLATGARRGRGHRVEAIDTEAPGLDEVFRGLIEEPR